jgi:glycosyltransferase involved in cell wall biosynthesis
MKVTIITICFNRIQTIEKSIQSVLSLDYTDIEYIVIDGNSTDGTQKIIEKYQNQIAHYISEPDQGMYDAINKGLALATGEVVGLMHSDDEFYDSLVVSKIVSAFNASKEIDGVYGDGVYISNDDDEKIIRNRVGGRFSISKIKRGWLPLHPTVYLRRSIIKKYGNYNLGFKIASDTEFLLRYLFKHQVNMNYVNSYFVKMRIGGLSTSRSRAIQVLNEDYRIYKFHGLPGFKTVLLKKMSALVQYSRSKIFRRSPGFPF